MYATATLPLSTQFLNRAHQLDASQWQRVGQRAGRIQITRILETVLRDWSFDDRVRAVGPQRRLFARHLGRIAARMLPAETASSQVSGRVFGSDTPPAGAAVIDAAALAALTALDQPGRLSADAARALYAPFDEAIPLQSLLSAAPVDADRGAAHLTLADGLAPYAEDRTPAFVAGTAEQRLQRRSQAVRHALATAAVAEGASRQPARERVAPMLTPVLTPVRDAWTAAWASDLHVYRPSRGAAAASLTLAAGIGLAAVAVFAFRGDAPASIAPDSPAVVSPAVLNPAIPDGNAAPVVVRAGVASPAAAPAATTDTVAPTAPTTPPAAPVDSPPAAPVAPATPESVPGTPAAGPAAADPAPPLATPIAACTDGSCWLAIASVSEADGEWAQAATAYLSAAIAAGDDDAATLDAQIAAALLRADHPAETAEILPAADAMVWLAAGLTAADAGSTSYSPLLIQSALDTLYALRSDEHLATGAYQAINAAPVGLVQGQFNAVGQLLEAETFLPIGRCADPNGRWMAIWFPAVSTGEIRSGWVNLSLANQSLPPLMGSHKANLALQNTLPVISTPVCNIL